MRTTPEQRAELASLKYVPLPLLADYRPVIRALIADLEEAQSLYEFNFNLSDKLGEKLNEKVAEISELKSKLAAAEKDAGLSDIALMKAYSRSNNGEQLSPVERVRFLRYARIAIAAQEAKP